MPSMPFYEEVYGRRAEAEPYERVEVRESESDSDSESSTSAGIFKSPTKRHSKRSSTMARFSQKSRKSSQTTSGNEQAYKIRPSVDSRRSIPASSSRLAVPEKYGIFSDFSRGRNSGDPPPPAATAMMPRMAEQPTPSDAEPKMPPPGVRAGADARILEVQDDEDDGFLSGLEEAAKTEKTSMEKKDEISQGQEHTNPENEDDEDDNIVGDSKTPTQKPGRTRKNELHAVADPILMDTPRRTRGDVQRRKLQEERERLERRPKTRAPLKAGITKTGLNGRRQETARSATLRKTRKHKNNTTAKPAKQAKQDRLVNWRGKVMELKRGQGYVVI